MVQLLFESHVGLWVLWPRPNLQLQPSWVHGGTNISSAVRAQGLQHTVAWRHGRICLQTIRSCYIMRCFNIVIQLWSLQVALRLRRVNLALEGQSRTTARLGLLRALRVLVNRAISGSIARDGLQNRIMCSVTGRRYFFWLLNSVDCLVLMTLSWLHMLALSGRRQRWSGLLLFLGSCPWLFRIELCRVCLHLCCVIFHFILINLTWKIGHISFLIYFIKKTKLEGLLILGPDLNIQSSCLNRLSIKSWVRNAVIIIFPVVQPG